MKQRLLIAGACIALSAAATAVVMDVKDPPETHLIQSSFVFDVEDPELLAGYASVIALVHVDDAGTLATIDGIRWTDYQVTVKETLKGEAPASPILVRQLGGHDGEDTYVREEQPLLAAGAEYVLTLTLTPGQSRYTIVGGPISAKKLPDQADDRAQVVATWQQAIRNQRRPQV